MHVQVSSAREIEAEGQLSVLSFHSMLPTSASSLPQSLFGPIYQCKPYGISIHFPDVFNMRLVHL